MAEQEGTPGTNLLPSESLVLLGSYKLASGPLRCEAAESREEEEGVSLIP